MVCDWTLLPKSHDVLEKYLTWIQDGILFLLMALRWWQLSPEALFVHCLPVLFFFFLNTIFRKAPREFPEIWHKCPHVFKDELIRCWCWSWKLVFLVMVWALISLKCLKWWGEIWHDFILFFKNLTKGDTTFSHLVRYWVPDDYVDWLLFGLVLKMCVRHPHLRFAASPHQILFAKHAHATRTRNFSLVWVFFWPNSRITPSLFYL